MQDVSLPAEFALLAACCRWPLTADVTADIRLRSERRIDWGAVARLAEHHRVVGLVHHALHAAGASIPPDVRNRLTARSQAIARQNLALAAETVRLQQRFDAAGIPVLTLKGLALAQRAYGGIAHKHGRDIDLLASPDRALSALRMLEEDGYALVDPAPTMSERQRQAFIARGYELQVAHGNGAHIELHWRLNENPYLTQGVDAFTATQAVPLAGGTVRTLDDAGLFAYLCVHGANHVWFRLKWLADLNALLAQFEDADIDRLYRRAQVQGAGLCAAQGLTLCETMFGRRLPSALAQELRHDRRVQRLVAFARRKMLDIDAVAVPDASMQQAKDAAYGFLLGRGIRFLAAQAAIVLVAPADVLIWRLPRPLWCLYPLLRVPAWLVRRRASGDARGMSSRKARALH